MAEGATYPASFLDTNGNVREGQQLRFDDETNQPATAGLPVGWSQSGDPANVSSGGGGLDLASEAGSGAVNAGGVTVGGDLKVFGDSGFYGTNPVGQPNVPMTTPGVQDVIDALVLLGLVEQSD
jgi:hypothetical protein